MPRKEGAASTKAGAGDRPLGGRKGAPPTMTVAGWETGVRRAEEGKIGTAAPGGNRERKVDAPATVGKEKSAPAEMACQRKEKGGEQDGGQQGRARCGWPRTQARSGTREGG